MPIRIQSIHARQLGPIPQLEWQPTDLNLVYGKNEQGKTHLVEFLIRSLFQPARQWGLRNSEASGRVLVSGADSETLAFSPKAKARLDDLWTTEKGLPEDFSRLLVVKGAELALGSEGDAPIDRGRVKHFLSGRLTLERIENRISKTVQESRLHDAEISGSRRGELKDRELLLERLKTLDQLFIQVDKRFSGGRRRLLEAEKRQVEGRLAEQDLARRYLAWQIQQQVDGLEQRRRNLSRETLQTLRDQLNLFRQKEREMASRREDLDQAEARSRHHEWLFKAADIYEGLIARAPAHVGWPLPVLAGVAALAAGVSAIRGLWPVTLGGLVLLGILFGLIFRKLRTQLQNQGQSEELRRLQEAYQERMAEPLTGLPQLRERIDQCSEDYARARLLTEQLESDARTLDQYAVRLEQLVFQLTGQKYPPTRWEAVLLDAGKTLESIEESLQSRKIQLAQLDVDPSDYVTEGVDTAYSRQEEEALRLRLQAIDQEIREGEERLEDLKRAIFAETQDKEARNWSALLEALKIRREEVAADYREKTAQIIGKKLVHRVIASLERDEDGKIAEALDHESVRRPLLAITGRYQGLAFEGQRLTVFDPMDHFDLGDLSTGAREQVLLALRLGFASRLAGGEPLFLILDDAFQYSDWDRRIRLVGEMVSLVRQGWQVFYFTMDDHIRELFEAQGQALGQGFGVLELGT